MLKKCRTVKQYKKIKKFGAVRMKKSVLLFAFAILITCTVGAKIIDESYYAENRESISAAKTENERIMPNTLRLVLVCGENGKISTEVFPEESKNTELFWSLERDDGTAEVTLSGREFMVYGKNAGEDVLKIRTSGGAERSVAISVEELPKVFADAEEKENDIKHEKNTEKYESGVRYIRGLLCASVVLLFGAFISYFARRRRKN